MHVQHGGGLGRFRRPSIFWARSDLARYAQNGVTLTDIQSRATVQLYDEKQQRLGLRLRHRLLRVVHLHPIPFVQGLSP